MSAAMERSSRNFVKCEKARCPHSMYNCGCLQNGSMALEIGCERELFDFESSAYIAYSEINKNNKILKALCY